MTDVDEKTLKQFETMLNYFGSVANVINPTIERFLLDNLKYLFPYFDHIAFKGQFPQLDRITINRNVLGGQNKRIFNTSFLTYPPAKYVTKYGRANLRGQSTFYGTNTWLVAINEVKPSIGDLITKTTWRLNEGEEVIYCPIFKNQPTKEAVINPEFFEIEQVYKKHKSKYPPNSYKLVDSLMQFVADAFTKDVAKDDEYGYFFSAYFADKIFNELSNGEIEAIWYPSVANKLSFSNVAVKPSSFDKKYKLVKVKDSVIVSTPTRDKKGYFMEGLGETEEINYTTGEIAWSKNYYQGEERLKELQQIFGISIVP